VEGLPVELEATSTAAKKAYEHALFATTEQNKPFMPFTEHTKHYLSANEQHTEPLQTVQSTSNDSACMESFTTIHNFQKSTTALSAKKNTPSLSLMMDALLPPTHKKEDNISLFLDQKRKSDNETNHPS